ncbi:hypothetical protein AURDEDRAFT_166012 [Auricularia subglabra TFB-10046 SS5]|nr:hypothetical protein AURDEDRAFT_166012 [Auricularia subglabra TFB-10046 SS5]
MEDAPHSQSQHFLSIVEQHDSLVSSVLRLGTLANHPSGPQIGVFDVALLINAVDDLLIRAQQASAVFPPFELANLHVSCLEMKHFLHQLPCSPVGSSSNAPYSQTPPPVLPSSVLHAAFSPPARNADLIPAPAAHAPIASVLLSPYVIVISSDSDETSPPPDHSHPPPPPAPPPPAPPILPLHVAPALSTQLGRPHSPPSPPLIPLKRQLSDGGAAAAAAISAARINIVNSTVARQMDQRYLELNEVVFSCLASQVRSLKRLSECPICHSPSLVPWLLSDCGHTMCETCLILFFGDKKNFLSCPCCSTNIHSAPVQPFDHRAIIAAIHGDHRPQAHPRDVERAFDRWKRRTVVAPAVISSPPQPRPGPSRRHP